MPAELPAASTPLPLGSRIGILGGGQLARMLAMAAARLGMRTHIFCPDPLSPAFEVTPHRTVADYDDEAALAAFAAAVDVVTYEFENVPARTAEILARLKPLRPDAKVLAIAQDRLAEKGFLARHGIPVATYAPVENVNDLKAALQAVGTPAVLKTTRLGYDGKGQAVLNGTSRAEAAFASLNPKPLVLEAFVSFEREISVVVARNGNGETSAFDPAENLHQNQILSTSTVPANISAATAAEAVLLARTIVERLGYIGVMGVEFFVLPGGKLLVNEIAPRVHNSGHWTEAVCITDQFEQHIRAILNWPMGDTARLADIVMENLIGEQIAALPARLGPRMRPHIYGKASARPGRKMGHISHIGAKTPSR